MNENWNPETTATQKAQVREILLSGRSITPLEALREVGSLRLSAIIFDLRDEGIPIVTEKLQVSPKKRVAKYYIDKEYLNSLNKT